MVIVVVVIVHVVVVMVVVVVIVSVAGTLFQAHIVHMFMSIGRFCS